MTEFKISLEDQIVKSIGYNKIEDYLNKNINQIILKLAAQDVLNDLENLDLNNDDKWNLAREAAWKEQGKRYKPHT